MENRKYRALIQKREREQQEERANSKTKKSTHQKQKPPRKRNESKNADSAIAKEEEFQTQPQHVRFDADDNEADLLTSTAQKRPLDDSDDKFISASAPKKIK